MDAITELKQDLKNGAFARVYVFYGEEDYLKEFYRGELQNKLLGGENDEFSLTRIGGDRFELQYFVDAISSYPMSGGNKLVVVNNLDLSKLPDADKKQLKEQLADVPEFTTVLFYYDAAYTEVEYRIRTRRISELKSFGKGAKVLEFSAQGERELARWCTRHLARAGIELSAELAEYLVEYAGHSMSALRAELEKLAGYCTGQVRKEDIELVVTRSVEIDQFELSTAIADGKYRSAMTAVGALREKRMEPLEALAGISAALTELLWAKCAQEKGVGSAAVVKDFGIKPNREFLIRRYMSRVRGVSRRYLEECLLLCTQTDLDLKRSRVDGWIIIENMIGRMMQLRSAQSNI